ncbi:MAG: bifunctional nuclease family protein [Treponema sp.]|jgi:bifunctional DNase/RNase|nr:bifunctional nuclease family protein [Treponema sp.]
MLKAEIWGIAETGDGYMIFVKPLKSEYSVPIFIGKLEAQAILIGFGGITISRPLTADLLHNLIKETDYVLLRAEICDLKDNTFFGKLVLKNSSGIELALDSRPSDALALAIRCKSPIYINERVVKEAGILIEDLENPAGTDQETKKRLLKAELEEAVATENYERAAEIRDTLNLLE